jgi:hypothetical protein
MNLHVKLPASSTAAVSSQQHFLISNHLLVADLFGEGSESRHHRSITCTGPCHSKFKHGVNLVNPHQRQQPLLDSLASVVQVLLVIVYCCAFVVNGYRPLMLHVDRVALVSERIP